MKHFLIFLAFLPLAGHSQVSPEEVVAVVQNQLEAYNQRDLERFIDLFHDDTSLFNLGDEAPIAKGKEQLTEIYKRLFDSSPNLRSDVVSRQVIGNKVLDYEIITGRQNHIEPVYLIAIYEIEDRKIRRCYFISQ